MKQRTVFMRRRSAFTLIELLVVILILAILAALIVPRVVGRTSDAKRAKAASDIAALTNALNNFRLDCDRFPTSEEGLDALRTQPGDVTGWRGPYIEKAIPPDPWQNPYVYEYPGSTGDDSFFLISYGSDGAPGGEGDAADVGNDEELG
ncbi:MAG: type II secretion system major pseudopilin GspG [Methanoregulaceae archaeon]|jgi:general secretion pathway protein G|nr:type II secretion system major pseudopilin GspG [Methanoregulaceae archaeon]